MAFWEKKCWQEAEAIITVSENLKNILISNGINSNKITSVHNGVDISLFDYRINGEKIRKKYNISHKFVIGFVGAFYKHHGIEELIKNFQKFILEYDNIHLLLVGDGATKKRCEYLVNQLNLNSYITFTGYIDYQRVPEYIAAFDIALMPDSNDFGSPIKLFEYMAMKKVVLFPDYAPILEIIKHQKTGLIFEKQNIESLIGQLKWSLEHKEELISIAEEAFNLVMEKYTWRENAKRVLQVCQQTINK